MQPIGGSYIVNIMYTALLLIVLLERAVTVEFPGDAQKKGVILFRWHFRFQTLTKTDFAGQVTHNIQLFLLLPHDVVVDLHERRGRVKPT